MKKNNNKEKVIPTKNYVKFGLICLFTIIAVFYANSFYKNYSINKLNAPYIKNKINTISYSELSDYLIEYPNIILYVGTNNNEKCYGFEKELYKTLNKYNLVDNAVFLDLSENYSIDLLREIQNKHYSGSIINKLNNVPALLIVKEGKIIDSLVYSEDNNLTSDKVVQFLEEFEYIK